MKKRTIAASALPLLAVSLLSGCYYRTETKTTPAASPATTVVVTPGQRVVTYPEGQYELRGDGTANAPYYWVWIPRGATAGTIPPAPPIPSAR